MGEKLCADLLTADALRIIPSQTLPLLAFD